MTDQRKSFDANGQFAWDQTSINLAQTCLRKYKLKILEGWESQSQSDHLIFGRIYASALELYHKKIAEGLDDDAATIEVVRYALVESWGWTSLHNTKTRPNLIRTIIWYLAEFGQNDTLKTYTLQNGKPAVELSFAFEFYDDFLLTGHLDRVVTHTDDNDLYITDNKTTGTTISSYYFNQFNPDNQMSLYAIAGRAILKSPIQGVIIDAAQIAVHFSRFARATVFRAEDQLEEWNQVALETILSARQAVQRDYFPPNFTACNNYGGCEFRSVCSSPTALRNGMLKSNFTKTRGWDPLETR